MERIIINAQTGERRVEQLSTEEVAKREAYERDVVPGILLQQLRTERNARLAETDYLALADFTLTDEMRAYRQALRDLPANTADPANPVWPTKPGGNN